MVDAVSVVVVVVGIVRARVTITDVKFFKARDEGALLFRRKVCVYLNTWEVLWI